MLEQGSNTGIHDRKEAGTFIKISDIEIGDRFRKVMDDQKAKATIKDLSANMLMHGQLQPILVVALGENQYRLIAGERRIRAAKMNNWEEIRADIYGDINEANLRDLELSENVHRLQMSWDEEVALRDEIFNLKVKRDPKFTQTDNAKLFGESIGKMSQDLKLAEMLKAAPALKGKCKTKGEALALLKKAGDLAEKKKKAKRFEKEQSGKPEMTRKKELVRAYVVEDFKAYAQRALPDNTIDLVEIDSPYAIDLKGKRKKRNKTNAVEAYNEIDVLEFINFKLEVYNEAFRVMKDDAWLIDWFGPEPWFEPLFIALSDRYKHDDERYHALFHWLEINVGGASGDSLDENLCSYPGFQTRRIPALWYKRRGQTMQPQLYLANTYEMFFYARKGKKAINKSAPNVFDFPLVNDYPGKHPTERPIEMMTSILSTFASKGSKIWCPFLGSGNTILAANNIGCVCTGTDLSKQYKESYIVKVAESELEMYGSYKK